jgi:hypothetical protein
MTLEQNIQNEELEQHEAQDTSGLAEIEQALKEIEELQNNSEEQTAEEEYQEEIEEDAPEVPIEQEKKKTKLWKEKKQKYRLIEEKQALHQEILQLKEQARERDEMLNQALNSGTYHYGKSAYADLERAKENKKKAIENGDLDSLMEADVSFNKAMHTINDLEKWAYSGPQGKGESVQHNNYEQPEYSFNEREQEIARDWLEDHEYLNPRSKKYDVNLASKVIDFTNALDTNLQRQGSTDAIFSDEYFDTVDNYIATIRKESPKNLKSSNSVAPVGAVRNSYTSSVGGKSSNTIQIALSPEEKMMCSNMNVSEKEWLKYKLEDLKNLKKGK